MLIMGIYLMNVAILVLILQNGSLYQNGGSETRSNQASPTEFKRVALVDRVSSLPIKASFSAWCSRFQCVSIHCCIFVSVLSMLILGGTVFPPDPPPFA